MLPAPPTGLPDLLPVRPAQAPARGHFGTAVDFVDDPTEAARQALRDRKLLFVIHVAGDFKDSKFTSSDAEALRAGALANDEVGKYLNTHFVATFQKVGTSPVADGRKQGGNVASYFCTTDGGILDAIAGPVDAPTLLREARWVVETYEAARLESRGDVARYAQFFRMAHVEQLPHNAAVASVNWSHLPFFPPTAGGMTALLQRQPLARSLDQQGRVHLLLALYPLVKLDEAYRVIYDEIVGE
jgi:hypothetical protein